jgi:hypothetical protein
MNRQKRDPPHVQRPAPLPLLEPVWTADIDVRRGSAEVWSPWDVGLQIFAWGWLVFHTGALLILVRVGVEEMTQSVDSALELCGMVGGMLSMLASPFVLPGGVFASLAPREAGARLWQWGLLGCVLVAMVLLGALFIRHDFFLVGLTVPAERGVLLLGIAVLLGALCACMTWSTAARTLGPPRLAFGFRVYWAVAWALPLLAGVLLTIAVRRRPGLVPDDVDPALVRGLCSYHALTSVWLTVLLLRLRRVIPVEQGKGPAHPEAE